MTAKLLTIKTARHQSLVDHSPDARLIFQVRVVVHQGKDLSPIRDDRARIFDVIPEQE